MGQGSFIQGIFLQAEGEKIQSFNPAQNFEPVFESTSDIRHVELAVSAAEKALPSWRALNVDERLIYLRSLEEAFKSKEEELALMITQEMGKIWSESIFEAKNVSGRIALTAEEGLKRVATERPKGISGETRYHAQGVLAVLGPYNFPAHLMNSHIIPALISGNTVVAKPSELTPGVGEIYAKCFEQAGLPPGVFNLIQGRGDIGKSLVTHPRVRGVLFTGSYQTGRAINEMLLDHPHKLVALEMGGRNTSVVLDDADLYQALVETIQGAFQSAGQRCTATTRVLIDASIAARLIPSMVEMARQIKPGDPMVHETVLGPLASKLALERFWSMLKQLRETPGCEVLLEAEILPGGSFITPSVYQMTKNPDVELFGPHIDIEIVNGIDEAIARVNESNYGLSNSIFTRSEAKFERFYRETYSGVLNWNRSTNGLSGKAPFGGIGKSGNHRPAGIDAIKNATYPVMVQRLAFAEPEPLAPLASMFQTERIKLESSLDELVVEHEREFSEQQYRYFEAPYAPKDLKLPASEVMLQRLYRGDLVPREKKEAVVDLFSSHGPYLVSIDEEPLVIFDAASQIASLGLGFNSGVYRKALDEGLLTKTLLSNGADISEDIEAYKNLLLSRSLGGLGHVTFTTSGASANEKAFDLCRVNGPGGKRILAFEGSFHGRTLMSLHATYNPEKRKGFELAGYEVTFLPFGSLEGLEDEILKGDICATIVEPVQCEGGDNFADIDFFRGLRAVTRAHGVPLIFDEVQTGFGLLGPFYYHTSFGLEDGPDCVTLSKKAQLGVVLSAWPDTRPEYPHGIQIQRGLLQAEAVLSAPYQQLEKIIREQLDKLHQEFPGKVLNPRNTGYAFAFDMPTPEEANKIVNQRFHRGFMVYIAGTKTLRFRANIDTTHKEIEFLFGALRNAISGETQHFALKRSLGSLPMMGGVSIEALTVDNWSEHVHAIAALEEAAYEPSRQDSMEFLHEWLVQPRSIGLLVRRGSEIVGFAIGGPLEHSQKQGPVEDPMRGLNNTFYSTDIVIHESLRSKGLGYHLKSAQIEAAKALGYTYMTGRNRVGSTGEIQRIAKSFGAYMVAIYEGQYGEDAQALYYRIPLRRPHVSVIPALSRDPWIPGQAGNDNPIDWSNAIQSPVGLHAPELQADLEKGIFTTAVGTKLTLSNFITPDFVRYTELLRHLMPESCKHVYFTSGRDEIVDKGLRSLRVSRPKAQIAIGLPGQYLGHTTASARSLTDPDDYQKPFSWFNWPLVASSRALEAEIEKHGAEQIFGIVIELVGEKSGQVVSNDFLKKLDQIRSRAGVPLIFVETASGLGRNGRSLFLSDSLPVQPNMIWWYSGAQLGHVFVDDAYYVSKPLTLISTWDGDEISMRRTYRHLLMAHECLHSNMAYEFETRLTRLTEGFMGQGLWQVLDLGTETKAVHMQDLLRESGLLVARGFSGRLVFCPPINMTSEELNRGLEIVQRCLTHVES